MAPLTWRNVDAPNFSGANDMWQTAASLMNSGIDRARQGLADFRATTTDEQSAALMQQITAAGNDPTKIAAVTAGANPSFLSPAALAFANNQPGVLLDRQGKQLQNTGEGILNTQRQQNVDTGAYNFDRVKLDNQREDQRLTNLPQAMADMSAFRAEVASGKLSPEEIAAKEQAILVKHGQTLKIDNAKDVADFTTGSLDAKYKQEQSTLSTLKYGEEVDKAIQTNDAKSIADNILKLAQNDPARASVLLNSYGNINSDTKLAVDARIKAMAAILPVKTAVDKQLEADGLVKPTGDGVIPQYTPAAVDNTNNVSNRANNVQQTLDTITNTRPNNPLTGLVDRTEGAGQYNTLYNNSQQKGQLAGVDVSKMTIGSLKQFASKDGAYGRAQKDRLGYLATPMGRYQIVGQTLAATAKKLGLADDVVFTPEVQDAMFNKIASDAISGPRTMEGKMAALRGQWEGFKNVSDKELAAAITSYQGGNPLDLNNLQRGETNNVLSGANVQDVQRQSEADKYLSTIGNDPRAKNILTTDTATLGKDIIGQTAANNTTINSLVPAVTAKDNNAAAALLAQQATKNEVASTPDAAAQKLLDDAKAQTDINNNSIAAKLVEPVVNTPKAVDTTKEVKFDDKITIPAVDPTATRAVQDGTLRKRNFEVNNAVKSIAEDLGKEGGNAYTGFLQSSWDYFTADPNDAAANDKARATKQEALPFYKSSAAYDYFRKNPEALLEAKKDPVAFALNQGKNIIAEQTKAAEKQSVADAVKNGNDGVPSDTPSLSPVVSRTRQLDSAETVEQAFAVMKATRSADTANDQYASVRKAINDSTTENALSANAVANKLIGKEGELSSYDPALVTNAIQEVADALQIAPSVAGALVAAKGTYSKGTLGFGAGYTLDIPKIKEFYRQTIQQGANAKDGISDNANATMSKFQAQKVNALETVTKAKQKLYTDALADPNTPPDQKMLIQKALEELPAKVIKDLKNIEASGFTTSNIRKKTAN